MIQGVRAPLPQVFAPNAERLMATASTPIHVERGPDRIDIYPQLPPYPKLAVKDVAEARQRGGDAKVSVRALRDSGGNPQEPVSMVLTATKEELQSAFDKAGWTEADQLDTWSGLKSLGTVISELPGIRKIWDFQYDAAPVSDQYLDGKLPDLVFQKNNDHDLGRDHLRIYDTGEKAADGRSVWHVAATRDTGVEIKPKSRKSTHLTDHAIDGERDMIMADLLATSEIQAWDAAKGVPVERDRASIASTYQTDGLVYRAVLNPHPDLTGDLFLKQPGRIRKAIEHSPKPIKNAVYVVDKKLTKVFHSIAG